VDEEDGNVVFPNDEDNPEIMEDGEDFDPEKHEVEMLNKIFDPVGSLFIDGNFYVEGEDMEYDETKLIDLLTKTRKFPEMLILFMVSNTNMKKRLYHKDKIKAKFEAEMKVYREKRKVYLDNKFSKWEQGKNAAMKQALQDGDEWDEEGYDKMEDSESGDEAAEPDAANPKPEKPEALGGNGEDEGRLDKVLNKLVEQWEGDKEKVADGWFTAFKEANIPIRVIKAEGSIKQVFNQLDYHLKPLLLHRENMLERQFQQFVPV
jgi:hypothetical protein